MEMEQMLLIIIEVLDIAWTTILTILIEMLSKLVLETHLQRKRVIEIKTTGWLELRKKTSTNIYGYYPWNAKWSNA
jgi:hypothetical protein